MKFFCITSCNTRSVLRHVRQRSPLDNPVRSFVMKIIKKDDFDKIIEILPYKTGCRWYDPTPPEVGNRPKGYFNNRRPPSINQPVTSNRSTDHDTPSRVESNISGSNAHITMESTFAADTTATVNSTTTIPTIVGVTPLSVAESEPQAGPPNASSDQSSISTASSEISHQVSAMITPPMHVSDKANTSEGGAEAMVSQMAPSAH